MNTPDALPSPEEFSAHPQAAPSRRAEIARRAREIWEQEGQPEGEHERHWQEAERQLGGTTPVEQTDLARSPQARKKHRG